MHCVLCKKGKGVNLGRKVGQRAGQGVVVVADRRII